VGALAGRLDRRQHRGSGLFSADTLDDYRYSAWVDIGVSLLDIAAAALAIVVVRRITARQLERETGIEAAPLARAA